MVAGGLLLDSLARRGVCAIVDVFRRGEIETNLPWKTKGLQTRVDEHTERSGYQSDRLLVATEPIAKYLIAIER